MATYVYFIQSGWKNGAIKIGVASNVEQRMGDLQIGNPFDLMLVASISCSSRKHAYSVEGMLHRTFRRPHIRGEWFSHKINLKKVGNVFKKSELNVDHTDNEFVSRSDESTKLRAKVKSLEKTIEFQKEEIDDLLARLTADYEFKSK